MKNTLFQNTFILLVLLALCAWQPFSFLSDLQTKFDQYVKASPSPRINLIFNQPYYAPGDTAFFSAWYTDEAFQQIKGAHIITADLFSGEGKVYQQIKFKIQNGRAYNQIALRKDLPPGEFKLIAYTDWMKNSTQNYFEKTLRIESRKEVRSQSKGQSDVRAYPEGGHFIAGLSNKFVLLGEPGKTVHIKDEQNNEIVNIVLDSTGLATTSITPIIERKYTVQSASGKSFELPLVEKSGITLMVESKESGVIHMSRSGESDLPGQLFAIMVSQGKIILKKEIEWTQEHTASVLIPSGVQSHALNHLYVLDAKGKVYARRTFVKEGKQLLAVKFDFSEQAGQREQVQGKIDILDEAGNFVESDLSITVFQEHLFKGLKMTEHSFSNFPALYERELKFGKQNTTLLNDFLISESDRLDWNEILNAKSPIKSMPLNDQVKLRGQVVSKKNGQPAPDSTDVIVYLQKNTIGYEDYTKDGKFEIPFIFDFSGDDQVFHSLHYKSKIVDDDYDLIVDRDSLKINETWESAETSTTSAYGEYAFNRNLISRSYSFFREKKNSVTEDQNLNRIFEDEFLGADYAVRISDYLVFPTIEDIFNEIVPFVQYKKKGDKGTLRISYRSETSTRTYKEAPLLIIDGVMTRNLQSLLTLKPEKIVIIKILNNPNKLTQVGKLGENGILFVETKNGSLAKTLSEENLLPITGLSKSVLSAPAGDQSKSGRIPNLRSNLYWNPVLKTNSGSSEVSFYTGDDTGPIIIQVEGLTKDGRHFVAQHKVTVNFKSPNK